MEASECNLWWTDIPRKKTQSQNNECVIWGPAIWLTSQSAEISAFRHCMRAAKLYKALISDEKKLNNHLHIGSILHAHPCPNPGIVLITLSLASEKAITTYHITGHCQHYNSFCLAFKNLPPLLIQSPSLFSLPITFLTSLGSTACTHWACTEAVSSNAQSFQCNSPGSFGSGRNVEM